MRKTIVAMAVTLGFVLGMAACSKPAEPPKKVPDKAPASDTKPMSPKDSKKME